MSKPHDSGESEATSHVDYRVEDTRAEVVVTAVAEATGQSPLELDPLWEAVDPDALDALFRSPPDTDSSITVTFDYCGRHVTVTADGVRVAPSNSQEP